MSVRRGIREAGLEKTNRQLNLSGSLLEAWLPFVADMLGIIQWRAQLRCEPGTKAPSEEVAWHPGKEGDPGPAEGRAASGHLSHRVVLPHVH